MNKTKFSLIIIILLLCAFTIALGNKFVKADDKKKPEPIPISQMEFNVSTYGLEMTKPESTLWRFIAIPSDVAYLVARLAKFKSEKDDPDKARADVDIYFKAYDKNLVFTFPKGEKIPVSNVKKYAEAMYKNFTEEQYGDLKNEHKPKKTKKYKIAKKGKDYYIFSFTGRSKTFGAKDIKGLYFKAYNNIWEILIYANAGHFNRDENVKEVDDILKKKVKIYDPSKKRKKR